MQEPQRSIYISSLDLDTFTVENLIYGNGSLVLPNVAIPCCQSTVVWQQRQESDSSDVPPPGVSGATHSRDSTEPSRELRSTAKRVGNLCSSETAASQPKGWKNGRMTRCFCCFLCQLFTYFCKPSTTFMYIYK